MIEDVLRLQKPPDIAPARGRGELAAAICGGRQSLPTFGKAVDLFASKLTGSDAWSRKSLLF
jgi:hypothetical protein